MGIEKISHTNNRTVIDSLHKKKKTPTTIRVLLTSFVVDLIDLVTNAAVAIITGSVVMLAETLQGVADVVADCFLLVGYKRSKKIATRVHPFGFGKEAYFWTLLAGIVILLFTATLSFYFGLREFMNPEDRIESIIFAYVILIIAVFTNGYSCTVSGRKLLEGRRWKLLPRAFMHTVHVAPRTAFVLDSLGFLAALSGLAALTIYGITGDARYDGLGAMAIGILLAVASIMLLVSAKTFIAGRRASTETEASIRSACLRVSAVNEVLDLRTMVLGHRGLLVNMEVHFKDGLVTDEIEFAVDEIKKEVRKSIKGRVYIQIEPETPRTKRKGR